MSTHKKSTDERIDRADTKSRRGFSKKRERIAGDHDSGTFLDRLEGCVREIQDLRMDYEFTGGYELDMQKDRMTPNSPWNVRYPERLSLKDRQIERRRHLLDHVLTDLLEVISDEIGIEAVQSVFYSERYIPAEYFRLSAHKLTAKR